MSESVLVTGSSRGIGKAIASKLAADGFDIIVHCHSNREAGLAVCEQVREHGQNARLLQFDIANAEDCASKLNADIEEYGAYFGAVCNAGIHADNAFPAMPLEDWKKVVHTNLDGFYHVLNPLIMPMVRRRKPGRIITLSSLSGVMGNRGQVNYSAAKAGIIGASKALALELAKRKITVNCVAPGLIETDMIEDAPIEEAMKMIPLRRMGSADEVAATVAFLMSDGAAYITRQVINVNGGMC